MLILLSPDSTYPDVTDVANGHVVDPNLKNGSLRNGSVFVHIPTDLPNGEATVIHDATDIHR